MCTLHLRFNIRNTHTLQRKSVHLYVDKSIIRNHWDAWISTIYLASREMHCVLYLPQLTDMYPKKVGNAYSVPYAQKVWLYKDFSALLQCLRYSLMAFARFRSLLPYSTVLNRGWEGSGGGGGMSSPCRIIKHDRNDIHPLIFLATRYVWSRSCYLSYSTAKRVCTLQRLEREGWCTLQSFAPHERSTADKQFCCWFRQY